MSKAAETAKMRRLRSGREGSGNRSERRDGRAGPPSTVPAFPFPEVPDLATTILVELAGVFEGKLVMGGSFRGCGASGSERITVQNPGSGPWVGTLGRDSASRRYTAKSD